MKQQSGLPIAAYLGVLVALALAAAFVATLAIVIFLPPRPPDVMRADEVADHFQAGYDHMTALGRPMSERGVVWEVRNEPPAESGDHGLMATQHQLASALDLQAEQVRVAASHVQMDDAIVFRVRDIEALARQAEGGAAPEQVLAELQRAHEQAAERLEAAREAAQAAADARMDAEIERQNAQRQREEERQQAQIEANAERQALEAERQARAAERLAARLHRRVRIENNTIVVTDEADRDVDVEAPASPDPSAAGQHAGTVRMYRFEIPEPPTPPTAPAPASPAPRASPAPAAAPVPPLPPMFAPAPPGVVLISGFEFGAQLPDGRWLVMRQGRNWAELGWIGRAALVIGGTLLLLTILAMLFARRLTRPIRSFADAVQAVGVDPQSEPVREQGPSELRGAARAVNTMQARLRALIADRTKTLAAVAHDMRTPLMRLRLAAENVPPEQRERMAKEIAEVEALVASFIAFARDDPAEEARVRLDLTALLHSIADDHAEHGRNVTFEDGERVVITGQSLGLKRLFGNLVENALKYGARARIKLRHVEGAVEIDVDDDGPGVPAEQRESVFEPFVRLNEEGTRGAGLGLAAARSIARAHGGDVVIFDGENGALVRVTLPAH